MMRDSIAVTTDCGIDPATTAGSDISLAKRRNGTRFHS